MVGETVAEKLIDGVALGVGEGLRLAGAFTSTVPPVPSCPPLLSPQHEEAPPVVKAHVCKLPEEIYATPVSTGLPGGDKTVAPALASPFPSWPLPLLPQQYTPPDFRAQVW